MHRLIAGVADRVMGRQNPLRLWLTPFYGRALHVVSGGRGVPWVVNGETYRVDPRYRYMLPAVVEPDVAAFLRRSVRPGSTVLNVGANTGLYVMQLARIMGSNGRIIAFEPNPATAAILRRHVRMNGLESMVVVEELAAGAVPGSARLFDTTPGSGQSRLGAPPLAFAGRGKPASIDVRLVTIDDYCVERGLDPDLMVVDVEGYEMDVLRGAAETFRRRPALAAVVEIHPNIWRSLAEGRARLVSVLEDLHLEAHALTGQRDPLGEYGQVLLTRRSAEDDHSERS